jgi:transcriptional regulator with XRE-family HTH domain
MLGGKERVLDARRQDLISPPSLDDYSLLSRAEKLGLRIQTLRLLSGTTQGAASDATGLAVSSIIRIEKGRTDVRVSTLNRLATCFGVHPSLFHLKGFVADPLVENITVKILLTLEGIPHLHRGPEVMEILEQVSELLEKIAVIDNPFKRIMGTAEERIQEREAVRNKAANRTKQGDFI